MMFVLWSSPNHTPIKYRCPIKKNCQITHAYLSHEMLCGSVQIWFARPISNCHYYYMVSRQWACANERTMQSYQVVGDLQIKIEWRMTIAQNSNACSVWRIIKIVNFITFFKRCSVGPWIVWKKPAFWNNFDIIMLHNCPDFIFSMKY